MSMQRSIGNNSNSMSPHDFFVQAAFKRPPPGSNPEEVSNVDWDSVKAEDKTLLHQVLQHLYGCKDRETGRL